MMMKNIRIISTCKKEGMYWDKRIQETTEKTGRCALLKSTRKSRT